ncbi:MAG: hypothetical protein KGL69_00755 [Alphaproteobacteria bacterium]|nr:hypothetical protein [Alphaproteobacteria bacterium]
MPLAESQNEPAAEGRAPQALAPQTLADEARAQEAQGRPDLAARTWLQALDAAPDDDSLLAEAVAALRRQSRFVEAFEACARAMAADPPSSLAYQLGAEIAFNHLNDPDAAAEALARGVARFPRDPGLVSMAAQAAFFREEFALARDLARQALETASTPLAARILQTLLADHEGALTLALEALERSPDDGDMWLTAGLAAHQLGRFSEAGACYDRAEALSPGRADLTYPRADAAMLLGDHARAWRVFEALASEAVIADAAQRLPHYGAYWRGEPLDGKKILVLSHVGLGDSLMYARYAQALKAHGAARVTWCPAPALTRLFAGVAGVDEVLAAQPMSPDDTPSAPFDHWIFEIGLPPRFGAAEGLILDPGEGYLRLPDDLTPPGLGSPGQAPRDLTLPPLDDARLQVGICWSCAPTHYSRDARLLQPEDLRPLAALGDVTWHVLQRRPRPADFEARSGLILTDSSGQWADMADTARFAARLDLCLSIDSAPAHLAGALGLPTWVMIPEPPEWRWGRAGEASPWYPRTRIFRQSRSRDWLGVTTKVARALDAARGSLRAARLARVPARAD